MNRAENDAQEYVVGVDYGTLSGRAVVVRVCDGEELADAEVEYSHGVLDEALPDGTTLAADWALQVPEDYREVLRVAVPKAVEDAGVDPADVVGIATDFTACTMVPTLADGTPLNEVDGFEDRPHAYVKLWKHHAAQPQADRVNRVAEERGEPWLARYGGLISSEWEFAKGLQVFEEDREVYDRMERWVEAADWIVWQLCGDYVRNACSAGYKGILQDGQYPTPDFLEELAAGFGGFVQDKLEQPVRQLGDRAGRLTAEAARWTGLPEGIAVAVGNVDAHVTSAAVNALDAGQMVAIMGTSTCQVMNADVVREVPGMCGVVDGGIVAGSYGYEAGQSGVGDIFAWFTRRCVPESYAVAAREADESLHEHLTRLAAKKEVGSAPAGRPRLALGQPVGPGRPPSLRAGRRPDPDHPARGRVPGAAGVHRLRHAGHRGGLRRGRGARRGPDRGRRTHQEPVPDADVQRRAADAPVGGRLHAGTRAGVGHPCRRGRRLLPRRTGCCGRHGAGRPGCVSP